MSLSQRPSPGPSRWPNHRSYRVRLVITIVTAVMLGSLFTVTAVMKSQRWKPKDSSAQVLASKVDIAPSSRSPQEQRPDRPLPDIVQVVGPVRQDHKLRDLPYIAPKAESEERILTRYPRGTDQTEAPARSGISSLPQGQTLLERLLGPAPTMPSPLLTFEGLGTPQACSCAPSDSDGDVGPNHYVEAVNVAFKVFDKSGNTLAGPTTYNSLFAPLAGTPCSGQNNGDPYALYDPIADRWLISDFAFPSFPGTSFWQCIAVSQTPDPTGAYFLYALQVDAANPTYLGDYPKFGFWNNPQPGGAYFLTVNLFSNFTTFIGVRAFALDRASMLSGGPTHAIAFTILPAGLSDSYSLVAATFRTGNPPPAGRDEFLLAIDSPASENTSLTQVKGWKFHVDFVTPANSTLGSGASHSPDALIAVSPFVEAWTNAAGGTIVPQLGTAQRLDTVGDRIMTPVVYQNRAGTESLWADSTGILNFPSGPGVVRWYQFNVTGGNFPATPVQQQDWSNGNDGLWRFMPSIAVDQNGNAAIGYSASSSSTFPSIRYAGRLATDPLNNFGQGEGIMFSGAGSETDSDGRWGDYSMTTVDPADGMSFWHVNQYEPATGSFNWHTRIGKFNFVGVSVNVSGTKTVSGTFTPGSTATYTVTLTNSGTGAQNDNPGNEFTDVLPASLTLVSATATSGTSIATIATNTVTWNGAIAPGGSVTITITANIKSGTAGTTASNQGSINYDADFNGTNEASAVTDDPSVAGSSDPTSFVITKLNQTITFGALANKTFGDPDFVVSATASSGLPVSLGASGNCTVTSPSPGTVHITGAGSCTITASQAGDANYNAATNVPQSFTINKANQTITFGALGNKTFGDPDFVVSPTASSGLPVSLGASGNCTVTSPSPGTVHITAAGSCAITASQAGDANYNAATNVPQSFTINKANQTVTFGALANKTFGDPDFVVSPTASSGLPVSLGASGQCTVTSPSPGTVHITAAGSCAITASQAGDANYNAATNVPQTFTINKANQTITFGALANKNFGDPDFGVIATASSGLPVSLGASGNCTVTSPSPGSVHITGAGSCTITASQAGDANYNPATDGPQSFTIAKAATNTSLSSTFNPSDLNQSVTFIADVTSVGPKTGTVQFKDNGNNLGAPVALDNVGRALVTTSSLTAGTHTITADYSGDANFLASTGTLSGGQVVRSQPSLSINDVSITEGNSGTKVLAFTLTLSAGSNLPVSVDYATANGTATAPSDYVATNGSFTFNPLDGDVTRTMNVTINGDVNFEPDETFTVTLSNPVNATISKAVGSGTIQNDDVLGGFISFSQANYSVNESAGTITVTVTRTNDVSQAVNVEYATDDTGASANCAALNTGLASQRCDFTSVFGTLKFAANETQKTIDIPINLDAYTEGPETFTVKLTNPTGGAVLAVPSTATVTINDSAAPAPNAIDDTSTFVRQQYRDFLNREADATGLAFWKNNIDKCNDPAQRPPGQTLPACIETQRIVTSAAFFLSIEFKQTGGLVREFYVAALDRPLTNNMPNFVEFMRDTQGIQKGVIVGQGNWQQVLDANRTAFMNEFVTRPEFVALYPTTDTPAQYVDKLYLHAGVTPANSGERNAGIAEFGGAPTAADPGARGRALLRVTQNTAFQAREMNRTFVQIEYFGYLRRNPNDPPDNNFNGFDFWVNKLNQFNGDFLAAEMVKAFLSSGEYRRRFGP